MWIVLQYLLELILQQHELFSRVFRAEQILLQVLIVDHILVHNSDIIYILLILDLLIVMNWLWWHLPEW